MKKIIQQLTKLYPTKYIVLTKEYRRHINTELIYSVYIADTISSFEANSIK